MKTPKMSFSAAGDMLIQRKISTEYEGFQEVSAYIKKADARVFNLETTVHREEFWGNQFYGGSFLRADPAVLDIVKEYGFNMTSLANNHAMDFAHNGLLATLDAVRDSGLIPAGTGRNLDEAAEANYLDTAIGRVALISITSSMANPAAMAGRQSRRFPGRPGVNGLRIDEHVVVIPEHFQAIKAIAETSNVNAAKNISRAEGYTFDKIPDGFVVLKDLKFVEGNENQYHTNPQKDDVERVKKAIYEAQMKADYILVSVHSHQLSGSSKENPGEFLVKFAHQCIDAGAHAIIGSGPHLLRPIEIYKNRPIFYSLGDFMLHNESIPYIPEDMYEKYNMTSDDCLRDLFCKRSNNYTRGLMTDRRMLESVIPYFEMENGELTHLELMPIELNFEEPRWRSGNPRFKADCGIIERLAKMSAAYGTKIEINEKGIGIVDLSKEK